MIKHLPAPTRFQLSENMPTGSITGYRCSYPGNNSGEYVPLAVAQDLIGERDALRSRVDALEAALKQIKAAYNKVTAVQFSYMPESLCDAIECGTYLATPPQPDTQRDGA